MSTATMERPKPGAFTPAARGDVVIVVATATLPGKVLRSGAIRFRSTTSEALRQRSSRKGKKKGTRLVIRLKAKALARITNQMIAAHPELQDMPHDGAEWYARIQEYLERTL